MSNNDETPGEMIERIERETGQRWDDPRGTALSGLFGAVARAMGENPHGPKDDVAAGLLLQHQMTPEYAREQAVRQMMADMLAGGMAPADLAALLGVKK